MNTAQLATLMFACSTLFGEAITEQSPTVEELASANGIRAFCADLRLPPSEHPRLLAEVTDQNGKVFKQYVTPYGSAHELYRIRIFLFEDVVSKAPKRVIFNLSAGDDVACNSSIDFPVGSRLARTSSSRSDPWIYEVWIIGPEAANKLFFQVRFFVETSPTPYPPPSETLQILSSSPKPQ